MATSTLRICDVPPPADPSTFPIRDVPPPADPSTFPICDVPPPADPSTFPIRDVPPPADPSTFPICDVPPPADPSTPQASVANKSRLDQMLVERGLAESRTRAQALILAGRVLVEGARVDKAGTLVDRNADIALKGEVLPFVSRGGVKLAGALDVLGVKVAGLRCLDVGASTGGFTDCLLQRGAASVAAVDVGYGQLAAKLRSDSRVLVRERTNARALVPSDIGGEVDFTVVDASFIGLGKLLPAIARCTKRGGQLLALVKPQFEVGREEAKKGRGVVRDEALRAGAIERVIKEVEQEGFRILGRCDSKLPGPRGNVEAFVWAERVL